MRRTKLPSPIYSSHVLRAHVRQYLCRYGVSFHRRCVRSRSKSRTSLKHVMTIRHYRPFHREHCDQRNRWPVSSPTKFLTARIRSSGLGSDRRESRVGQLQTTRPCGFTAIIFVHAGTYKGSCCNSIQCCWTAYGFALWSILNGFVATGTDSNGFNQSLLGNFFFFYHTYTEINTAIGNAIGKMTGKIFANVNFIVETATNCIQGQKL